MLSPEAEHPSKTVYRASIASFILATARRHAKDRSVMNLRQLLERSDRVVERSDRPFASLPQVGRYFPAASMEDARQRLARSIERGEGPGMVLGAAGIGKSLLLQVLGAQFRERFDVVLLACAQLCTRRALLQAIHFELGLDYRRRDEGELRLSLMDTLLSGDAATQGLLLLVDESQALANHLLEELRLLTNLSRGGLPRVRLVMAGLPSLEEKLTSPELQSFSQRLSARCYLTAFSRTETSQYIRAQLAASQADPDQIFATAALESVFTATDGVPRLVNQLCDRALTFANTHRLERIDGDVVQAAWADLQQMPSAWQPPRPTVTSNKAQPSGDVASSVVEFGSLEDRPTPCRATVAAPIVSLHDELTELDEEPLPAAPPIPAAPKAAAPTLQPASQQPVVVRRPRMFSGRVPEAVDPFADRFEEEELVLDSFATLAGIFGTRAPRVENSREPAISRMVYNALQANDAAVMRDVDSVSDVSTVMPEREAPRPALRLAVVNDTPAVNEPIVAMGTAETNQPVLVIEDDPTESDGPQPGIRRENYRQLFSRLRHGT
jgi:type II secretory pathway predicted ATPase ExeA